MVTERTIHLSTKGFCDETDVTSVMEEAVEQSGIQQGLVCVSVAGSTAGVTTLEYEPNLVEDLSDFFESILPRAMETRHGKTWGDDNGFSHLRASLLGPSVTLPVAGGGVVRGTWQQVVVVDFDNRPRDREARITVIGD